MIKTQIALLAMLLLSSVAPAQRITTLASFDGTNGSSPDALTLAGDGNFYGVTIESGLRGEGTYGTLFRVTPNGALTLLFTFNSTNGALPRPMTLGSDGNLYGTTRIGGTNSTPPGQPGNATYGTIFRLTTNGAFTNLRSFDYTNGRFPQMPMILGNDGNLYGTTLDGGPYESGDGGFGIMYRLTTNGDFTPLGAFDGTNTGKSASTLALGKDGYFYGTTSEIFSNVNTYGDFFNGVFFRATTNGAITKLASFGGTNGTDVSPPIFGSDGNLYGTTYQGGRYNLGTVYRVTTNGDLSTIASFDGTNGAFVLGVSLTLGKDGILYGATVGGGAYNKGAIFQVTTNGVLTALASFDGTNNGIYPAATLTLGSDGNMYSTTLQGGAYGMGTVFKFTVPVQLFYQNTGSAIVLTWSNPSYALQSAPAVTGLYTNIPGAANPWTNALDGPQQFFRLIGQ